MGRKQTANAVNKVDAYHVILDIGLPHKVAGRLGRDEWSLISIVDSMEREQGTAIVNEQGDPWWVLKDICDVLEISNSIIVADRLDTDEVSLSDIIDSLGRKQETITINESGLYNVILKSDKPEAKEFRRWIIHEVLPSIRKHGAYMTPQVIENMLVTRIL